MTGRVSGTAKDAGGWGPFDRLRANGVVDGGCDGGDALGGDAPRPAPLDSCLRRNDARGVRGNDGGGGWGCGGGVGVGWLGFG